MKNLAVIPARGGSQRIKKKNIRDFLGKPIISYSIELALRSKLFDEVMVSTDNEEIQKISRHYGAVVPFWRSAENADDFATLQDVMVEVVNSYKQEKRFFDNVCCILPTAPLLTMDYLKKGFELLQSGNYDSVRPVCLFPYPIQKAFRLEGNDVRFFFPEYRKERSQDLEMAYHDAGQFYWMTSDKLLKGERRGAFAIDEKYVQDIDDETDWKMAEIKFKLLNT